MKLILAFLLLPFFSTAQFSIGGGDCGTWVESLDTVTAWTTVDTIGNKVVKTDKRDWVENEWDTRLSNITKANFCACGCPDPSISIQYRVCSITGIRQVRQRIVDYKYIPRPKTKYQKTIDSLSKH